MKRYKDYVDFMKRGGHAAQDHARKKTAKIKQVSYQDREEQRELAASREDRLRKPLGMSWGDYYKGL